MSSSAGLSSMLRLYLKPEHPPGSTPIRSPAVSGETFSSAMNLRTSTAAWSVRVSVMGALRCVVAIAILQSHANLESPGGPVNSRSARPARPCDLRSPIGWSSPCTSCRSEEHTSELQSPYDLVCRLLLEKKNTTRSHLLTHHEPHPPYRTTLTSPVSLYNRLHQSSPTSAPPPRCLHPPYNYTTHLHCVQH